MKLQETEKGTVVEVFVKPKSNVFQLTIEGDELVAFCRESPVKGKVNKELIKELARIFKRRVEMLSGFSSKQKRILISDISAEEVNQVLSARKSE